MGKVIGTRLAAAVVAALLTSALWWFNYPAQAPAPVGHPYVPTRETMILYQAGQVNDGGTVLLGDSITDGLYAQDLPGNVLNAGVGSARLKDVRRFGGRLLKGRHPAVIVLTAGVNDMLDIGQDRFAADEFRNAYADMCRLIEETGAKLVVSTILPVRKEEPGSKRMSAKVNAETLARANDIIREIAGGNGYHLMDSFAYMAGDDGYLAPELTPDGIHLSPKGYARWKTLIRDTLNGVQ
ncbi:MAG: SGNH/GDSL hydrolase family protein [Methylobacteriaceae bacterium]|jgi:lysophospholipase L1-like esterase|nr:SGNH/GDSL hydrolase family protein [Methylobacteriaceae bacterium]